MVERSPQSRWQTEVKPRNEWYPQWDSNPHWIDFKSIASADWAMGAYLFRLAKLEEAHLPPRAVTFTSS